MGSQEVKTRLAGLGVVPESVMSPKAHAKYYANEITAWARSFMKPGSASTEKR